MITNRSRIGHSYLNTEELDPSYDLCEILHTMAHVLINCPKYSFFRQFLNSPTSPEKPLDQHNAGIAFD